MQRYKGVVGIVNSAPRIENYFLVCYNIKKRWVHIERERSKEETRMRKMTRWIAFLLTAALCAGMMLSAASADVTQVKYLGDGSVEVRWDDGDASDLVFVPKMSGNYDTDLANYGKILVDTEGKTKMVLYGIAPGQSFWVQTNHPGSGYTAAYAYDAPRVANFTEWRTPPRISVFIMRERSMEGKLEDVDYFLSSDLEDGSNYAGHGVKWQLDYPTLKKARTYLWQYVITDPDDFKHVVAAGVLELPAGVSWVYDDFRELDTYFQTLMDMRGEVPVGTYTFSIYWDGIHVCSTTFKVR